MVDQRLESEEMRERMRKIDEEIGRVYAWDTEGGAPSASTPVLEEGNYAWELASTDENISSLKEELDLQDRLADEHQRNISGNEAQLETMIKDLRSELKGFRDQGWKLEQVVELDHMKSKLFLGLTVADEKDFQIDFEDLDHLNCELDSEMNALMNQLSLVRGEMEQLDDKRRLLLEELDSFDGTEDEDLCAQELHDECFLQNLCKAPVNDRVRN